MVALVSTIRHGLVEEKVVEIEQAPVVVRAVNTRTDPGKDVNV